MLKYLSWVVLLLLLFIFLSYNFFYAVDFPFQDDFLLIQFAEGVTRPDATATIFFRELFSVHNDHKAVIPRLIALANYMLTGSLNFRTYIVLSLVNLSLIFYFLYVQFRKLKLPIYYFLPVAFLFFHPLYYDISGWSLNGMQHTFTTVFTLGAIALVGRNDWKGTWWALLFCLLATFTHGNGIFSFPAIIFYLVIQSEWKRTMAAFVAMFFALGFYLYGYQFGQAAGFPDNFWAPFESFTGFIGGGMIVWSDATIWSVIWGAMLTLFAVGLLLLTLFNTWTRAKASPAVNIQLLSVFLYMLVMSMVIALFRSSAGGAIASRFQLYAVLASIIAYLWLLELGLFRKKLHIQFLILLTLGYNLYSHYRFTRTVMNKKTTYLADVYNWHYQKQLFSVERTIRNNADFYLSPATERGILNMPTPVVTKQELEEAFSTARVAKPAIAGTSITDWHLERRILDKVDSLVYFYVSNDRLPAIGAAFSNRFLALKNESDGHILLHAATPKLEGRRALVSQARYYKDGFDALFRGDDLDPGRYQMMLVDVDLNGKKTFYWLDNALSVNNQRLQLTLLD
ncbi:4-amino-4-deoxy-L-arabinose transferase-like glycosyltransferase [Dyadobacter jejuensis]|uniref:4-amino-4-deoxy-L-arabinose transferase-like glycosyltransferase n=1 Tax=Dyadobacter jejuensis TaxID=1082580 RepID=A0A316AIR8_9BACT|nr:hypothetical protein [Dyadobacter jejuensis]PWJ57129.1 4-amino-4-deoxy-L-arabinose transferase-like glycosyltransferase [Dyadobacter jejuensis]